jgi:hypothetical protein
MSTDAFAPNLPIRIEIDVEFWEPHFAGVDRSALASELAAMKRCLVEAAERELMLFMVDGPHRFVTSATVHAVVVDGSPDLDDAIYESETGEAPRG